ncbi:hypothetical protein ACROYT_G022893 [Oculina patagonica]
MISRFFRVTSLFAFMFWKAGLHCIAGAKQDLCRSLKFTTPLEGHALVGHVIKNLSIGIHASCKHLCTMESQCVSFNIGPPTNARMLCQLSDSDHNTHSEDLKPKEGFIYRATQNACLTNLCTHNGTCLNGFTSKGYLCECKPGFAGENCEKGRPEVSLSRGPSYVEKNKNVTLPTCHVTSFPPAVITWSKVRGEISQARAASKDGKLSIMNAQKNDSGLYKCKASNSLGEDSAVTQLVVVELPHFIISPPAQLKVNTSLNITVPCQATGDPKPTVTWMKENGELPSVRSNVSVNGTLEIWNTKVEDSGRYTCTASSNDMFANATFTMELTVMGVCEPVGVADNNTIPDARMTASTFHNINYSPYYGRLNGTKGYGAWCTKTKSDRTDYLQVDMGAVRSVCAVATQGHGGGSHWTTSYKVHLSTDGVTWNVYKENNVEKVFPGNTDYNSIVKHSLSTDVKARFVRFYPVSSHNYPCMRVEIFVLK